MKQEEGQICQDSATFNNSQPPSGAFFIKNTLYSFPLRDYSKNGLKVLLKDGIKNITKHSSDFEKLRVLFCGKCSERGCGTL